MVDKVLRTPEDRFGDLPDFCYPPRYLDDLAGYDGLRMAYLDEGPIDARDVFLCLHGEPTWSFLYRRMLPVFLDAGARVVAPDLFGFGRSDKPVDATVYTFDFHRGSLLALVERLQLRNVTLVVQDWGGLLGLTLPIDPAFRGRLKRLLVMNTTIGTGEPASLGFDAWRRYAKANPDLPIGALMLRSCPHLTAAEVAAYDAPFPEEHYKAGVRAFPAIVPTDSAMAGVDLGRAAQRFWRNEWSGPSFMAYGARDPVFPPAAMERLRQEIRGCGPAFVVEEGGHFVQEWGEFIATAALAHWSKR